MIHPKIVVLSDKLIAPMVFMYLYVYISIYVISSFPHNIISVLENLQAYSGSCLIDYILLFHGYMKIKPH